MIAYLLGKTFYVLGLALAALDRDMMHLAQQSSEMILRHFALVLLTRTFEIIADIMHREESPGGGGCRVIKLLIVLLPFLAGPLLLSALNRSDRW